MQVRILGPLEVWDDGRVVELGAGRQRALLALLALSSREVVATDRLIEELWGGSPPPTASKALQNLVSQLRRTLGTDAIATRSPGYRLHLEADDLDASQFERLAAEGRRLLEDDPRTAAQTLRTALELWRGPALVDFAYENFAQGEIARLDELRLGAIEDRIDADLANGGGAELVPELEPLVSSNPLRERLRGQLMLALYRSGRQAEALEVYREGRAALSEGLGLEPGAALRELEQAILNQDPALGPPTRLPRRAPRSRRRRLALVAGVLVLLVGAAAVALAARDGAGAPSVVPNSLVKIDTETNEIVDVIPVGRSPEEVVVVGEYVVVASNDDATLTRVDIRTGETTTSGASGADMGLAGDGNRYVWVVSLQQDRVTRVDVETLQSLDGVPLEPDLAFVFVAVGGRSLWISQFGQPAVLRYALRTLQLERRYDFPVYEVAVEPVYGYGAAWVGLGSSGAVLRIDARTGETTTIRTGSLPGPLAAGFGSIWSSSVAEGTLWRLDGVTGDAHEVVDLGRAPFGAATGAGSVWVANNCDGTVMRVDPETDEVVATVPTGHFPLQLAVGRAHVWVGIRAEPWDPEVCN
jgi:YVTN family beta-propeller protein